MESRLLHEAGGQRTFAVILATDDEVVASLRGIRGARKYPRGDVYGHRRTQRRRVALLQLGEERVRERFRSANRSKWRR